MIVQKIKHFGIVVYGLYFRISVIMLEKLNSVPLATFQSYSFFEPSDLWANEADTNNALYGYIERHLQQPEMAVMLVSPAIKDSRLTLNRPKNRSTSDERDTT